MQTLWRRFRAVYGRIGQLLWWRPLLFCLASILAVFAAAWLDETLSLIGLPTISAESLRSLLQVMSSSMLVVATFAVGSMVSAYASAATTATPRSFPLVVADDLSQNALSGFIGAFIFSVVAQVALHNRAFGDSGRMLLFVLTCGLFALVILLLIAWVQRIAHLGRLGNVIDRVEACTREALERRVADPFLGGVPMVAVDAAGAGALLHADAPGYVRSVDLDALQACSRHHGLRLQLLALPGVFASAVRPLLSVEGAPSPDVVKALRGAFDIGSRRDFAQDPRFGLAVLSEIACRALSPAVNDPGTAIEVLGAQLRLLSRWRSPVPGKAVVRFDRITVPALAAQDLCEDAFLGIGRDGAGCLEVSLRLQKVLEALAASDEADLREAAAHCSGDAAERANAALSHASDRERIAHAAERVMAHARDASLSAGG